MDYLKEKGHEVPHNFKNEISHLSFLQTAEYVKNRFDISDPIEKILDDWHKMAFNFYANKVKLKEGVIQFLEDVYKRQSCSLLKKALLLLLYLNLLN